MPSASVAIITRTKNRPLLLTRAIRSVLSQSYSDWIMVIVNDGGESQVVEEICKSFGTDFTGKYLLIHHENSVGMEEAGNRGALACDSTFMILHDDDDSWHPDFLQKCIDFFDHSPLPNLAGVITHWREIWEKIEGAKIVEVRSTLQQRLRFVSLYEMSFRCTFVPICFLYTREAWERAGRFTASLPLAGDWEFNLRFLTHYEIAVLPYPLANYHRRLSSKENMNAVQASPDLLLECANRVRNRFLRKDLEQGICGLGALMAINNQLTKLSFWQFLKRDLSLLKQKWASRGGYR